MSIARRSTTGCWTCRLRRKKCDESGFPCQNCQTRSIHCHGYGPRPRWKDGGEKEREQARRVLKRYANNRDDATQNCTREAINTSIAPSSPVFNTRMPELSYSSSTSANSSDVQFFDFNFDTIATADTSTWFAEDTAHTGINFTESHNPFSDLIPSSLPGTTDQNSILEKHPAQSSPQPISSHLFACTSHLNSPIPERDADLVTHYLDEVFQVQFGHHYPNHLKTKKGWILSLLTKSSTFYYTSLSLSAFHLFSAQPSDSNIEQRSHAFQDFQRCRIRAVLELRELLGKHHKAEATYDFIASAEILASTMQMIFLESLSGGPQNWPTYLEAARLSLPIKSLMSQQQISVLNMTPSPKNTTSESQVLTDVSWSVLHLPSVEQKVLELFGSSMIWVDILSSATAVSSPPLASLYKRLLAQDLIQLESTVGCKNWVAIAILEISELENWQKTEQRNGTLSIRELVQRSQDIETTLQNGINSMDCELTSRVGSSSIASSLDNSSKETTYIYACSALVYLHVVVSGPCPGVSEIRQSVAQAINSFQLLPGPHELRKYVWPYCISGCFALGDERDRLRDLMRTFNTHSGVFGSLVQVEAIVEDCWKCADQDSEDVETKCHWRTTMERMDLQILLI